MGRTGRARSGERGGDGGTERPGAQACAVAAVGQGIRTHGFVPEWRRRLWLLPSRSVRTGLVRPRERALSDLCPPYHTHHRSTGVVKALLERGVLPQVISGTSAGALVASFVCCRTDAELAALLVPQVYASFQANDEGWLTVLGRFVREGVLFDTDRWAAKTQQHITQGHTTFLEAYERTGRILNICVASDERFAPPLCLNYKTTPNVVLWSAILASAAVPGILHAVELREKRPDGTLVAYKAVGRRWRDGVLRADIPLTRTCPHIHRCKGTSIDTHRQRHAHTRTL
jgi:hypothetical protein